MNLPPLHSRFPPICTPVNSIGPVEWSLLSDDTALDRHTRRSVLDNFRKLQVRNLGDIQIEVSVR